MKTRLLLIVLCLAAFFANPGALSPDVMEVRNLVTAREMAREGHWVVPTMNGELRLEKPPLPTWVAGAIETIAPGSLAAQRMAPAVMALLWTLFLWLTVRYLSRRQNMARNAVLVFITCYNVILMGRSATWDIYCHAFMMGAVYCLLRAFYDEEKGLEPHKWRWMLGAGVMAGLSFESKGPVSFYSLLLPAVIAMVAIRRPMMRGKWLPLLAGVALCVAIGGWWYAVLHLFYPESIQAVLQKESGAWLSHNVRPWYYYWRAFLEAGLWAPFVLATLAIPYWRRRLDEKNGYLFVMTWMLGQLLLLSLMPEKKMRYLLPMAPTCAMAVAYILSYIEDKTRYRKAIRSLVWGFAGLCFVAEVFLLKPIGEKFVYRQPRTIATVCANSALDSLPFYTNPREALPIELVYEAKRKILPLDLGDAAAVSQAVPCVLVSARSAAHELSAALLERLDTVSLGVTNDNKHARSSRHYSQDFIKHLTILKPKHKQSL